MALDHVSAAFDLASSRAACGFALVIGGVLAACSTGARQGQAGAGGAGTGGTTGMAAAGGASTPSCVVTPGIAPARRLTRAEYNATVRDLLGETTRPADAFPAEIGSTEFGNDARSLDFSRLLMEQYFIAAQGMAARVTADGATLARVLACDPATLGEDTCAATFIERFGQRAYRRPLAADEQARLLGVYAAVRPGSDFPAAVGAVLQTMLQAPQFLYRVEIGTAVPDNPTLVKIDHFEIASRLSYLLWGTMPDDALFAAAARQGLGSKADVLVEATRMVQDPKAREQTGYFHQLAFKTGGIKSLTKDAALFPSWTAGLGGLLAQETARFLDYAVWEGGGSFTDLFTASYTFMNQDLARFYGVSGPTGTDLVRVDLDPTRASGFLTQAGPLTLLSSGTLTNPVRRGYFVRSDLLCDAPPPPPPDLNVVPPEPAPGQTTRESFAQHSSDAACAGCHRLLDPLGFAFESFDAIGLPRTMEQGKPIDTRGELVGTDQDGQFLGARDLLQRVAASKNARSCYVKHWYEFGYGRGVSAEDECVLTTLDAEFERLGLRVPDLIVALTQIDPFLYKAVDP
jgi:hypothetical protein